MAFCSKLCAHFDLYVMRKKDEFRGRYISLLNKQL